MRYHLAFLILASITTTGCYQTPMLPTAEAEVASAPKESIETCELGSTKNVHTLGNIVFSGQFQKDDIPALKEANITRVISFRPDGEIDWNEAEAVKAAGIDHVSIPFKAVDELTDDKLKQIRELLGEEDEKTMMHCGSANRVSVVWIAHRVLDDGVDLETAIEEANTIGLKSQPLKERVIEYIKEQQAAQKSE